MFNQLSRSDSYRFLRLLRLPRPDQSITHPMCLHRFTLNDRKWRARAAFVWGKSDLRWGRIFLELSFPPQHRFLTLAVSLSCIFQVSQVDYTVASFLHARTHRRSKAQHTLLMSILIWSRQNGVSALAQRKETGPFRSERCSSESGIPPQGNCMITFLMACFCSCQCWDGVFTVHTVMFRVLSWSSCSLGWELMAC